MAEGTTALDLALSTEGDADGTDLIVFTEGIALEGLGSDSPPGGLGTDAIGAAISAVTGPLAYIIDHEEQAARKLAPPFWGKPFIAALLASFTREIQRLEDDLWLMLELRTLPFADLPRLKVLGKIVGQPRLGFTLEEYRVMIEARALANVSRGRAGDLLAVLNLMLGEGDYLLMIPGGAEIYLLALQPISSAGLAMVQAILPDVRAAGVGLSFVSWTTLDYDGTDIIWDSSVSPGAGTAIPGVRTL